MDNNIKHSTITNNLHTFQIGLSSICIIYSGIIIRTFISRRQFLILHKKTLWY